MEQNKELGIPTLFAIKQLLEPIYNRLEKIESKIVPTEKTKQRFYRNEDLKTLFGLSNNTIMASLIMLLTH